jgi:hypothetical protein
MILTSSTPIKIRKLAAMQIKIPTLNRKLKPKSTEI